MTTDKPADSKTPRTDTVCITPIMGETCTSHKWDELQKLSRQLERELAEANARTERLSVELDEVLVVAADLVARLSLAVPVAWRYRFGKSTWSFTEIKGESHPDYECEPLYLAPPAPLAARPSDEALAMLKCCADFSSFDGEDDSIGHRTCCGEPSYQKHSDHCDLWNLILRLDALAKGEG